MSERKGLSQAEYWAKVCPTQSERDAIHAVGLFKQRVYEATSDMLDAFLARDDIDPGVMLYVGQTAALFLDNLYLDAVRLSVVGELESTYRQTIAQYEFQGRLFGALASVLGGQGGEELARLLDA